MRTDIRVQQWWEVRWLTHPAGTTARIHVFSIKKKALKELRRLRRMHKDRTYYLCRTREVTEIEYRKD